MMSNFNFTYLGKNDLPDVLEEVISIQSRFYALGRSLRLDISKLRAIRDSGSSESDALEDVLLLWLDKKYEVGPPTWRMLVVAVDKKTGGDDHELAEKIASRHPAATGWTCVITCTKTMECYSYTHIYNSIL